MPKTLAVKDEDERCPAGEQLMQPHQHQQQPPN